MGMIATKQYRAFGKNKTLPEWSKETGIHRDVIYKRIKSGWDVERALATRPRKYLERTGYKVQK